MAISKMAMVAVISVPILGLVGCGSRDASLYPVSGTLTVGGKPAVGAVVTLIPAEEGANRHPPTRKESSGMTGGTSFRPMPQEVERRPGNTS